MKKLLMSLVMVGIIIALIIVGIIAAIVIPKLITPEIGPLYPDPPNYLRTLTSVEATWFQMDPDGNGQKDFWTYDVSCFYRIRSDNPFIDISLAKADHKPVPDGVFGKFPIIETWSDKNIIPTPKHGYYYRAMLTDENGKPYNQEKVNMVKATNKSKFAFVAYPNVYGKTGVRTYIINEQGTIYVVDTGSDDNKIILQWPGKDPTKVDGPVPGKKWQVAD